MLPSSTVENYLKAILKAQSAEVAPDALVPMGQLASRSGVAPGTATTMVKTLAESGLVRYEPYAGVRLTRSGEKLAALVLRRHRLIELFLVRVLGMSWTEVHDEAEHLEHAVSERLIDRIDEMLGRPAVDPHGDPIPDPDGTVSRTRYDTLLTCPLHTAVTVQRVSDQDPRVPPVRRAPRAQARAGHRGRGARRRGRQRAAARRQPADVHDRRASRIEGARAGRARHGAAPDARTTGVGADRAGAQSPPPKQAPESESPFKIEDNSFLVEEAFNQEAGIFQNIFGAARVGGKWATAFTQEWPVVSQTHQLSYTVAFLDGELRSAAETCC